MFVFSNSKYQVSVRLESDRLGKSPAIKTGAYDDTWEDSLQQYLAMLGVRFMLMKDLLADTGCSWDPPGLDLWAGPSLGRRLLCIKCTPPGIHAQERTFWPEPPTAVLGSHPSALALGHTRIILKD